MPVPSAAGADLLHIDAAAESDRIAAAIRNVVLGQFRRKGVVVAVSGGVDSSVVAALCARALGPERVLALFLPESDSSSDSLRLGRELVNGETVRIAENGDGDSAADFASERGEIAVDVFSVPIFDALHRPAIEMARSRDRRQRLRARSRGER